MKFKQSGQHLVQVQVKGIFIIFKELKLGTIQHTRFKELIGL